MGLRIAGGNCSSDHFSRHVSNFPRRETIFDRTYRRVTIAVLTLVGLTAFDAVAVTAALPSIGGDFEEVARVPWVITAYLVTSAVAIVAAGPAIDRVGLRLTFRATIVLYTVATIGCALATTFELLIAMRAVQGIGGGFLLTVSMAAIGVVYPKPVRPRLVAAHSVVWAAVAILGPALAALFVAMLNWRGIFIVGVVLALLAAMAGSTNLPAPVPSSYKSVTFNVGSLLLLSACAVAGLMMVGDMSQSRSILTGVLISAVLWATYWRYGSRVRGSVLHRRYILERPFGAINVAGAASFGAALGLGSYLPLVMRTSLGATHATAAFSVAFIPIGWTLGALMASRYLAVAHSMTVVLYGYALIIASLVLGWFYYQQDVGIHIVAVVFMSTGVGLGAVSLCLLTILQAAAKSEEVGRATSAYQFCRMLSYAYSTAILGFILLFALGGSVDASESVRDVLAGRSDVLHVEAREVLIRGYRRAHLASIALVSIGATAAMLLWRGRGQEQ